MYTHYTMNPIVLQDLYCTFSTCLKQRNLFYGQFLYIDGTKIEENANNKYTFV